MKLGNLLSKNKRTVRSLSPGVSTEAIKSMYYPQLNRHIWRRVYNTKLFSVNEIHITVVLFNIWWGT